MAIFFDNGGGDTYAGPTKEAVIAAMQADDPDVDLEQIFEVSGGHKVRVGDENGDTTDEFITLDEEYDKALGAYLIASENY